jgi:hypothetical protein
MTQDATFEDGREAPLNLGALDGDDLQIVAALAQDAVLPITEMKWNGTNRRFAMLLNRFRWEDHTAAIQRGRQVERVQSLLTFDNVLSVASQGIDRSDKDTVLSLLAISWTPDADPSNAPSGEITLTLAGDGAIRMQVEAIEASLRDVTRPYLAPSKTTPHHNID